MPPPLELTEALAEAICAEVEAGQPITLAAESAGYSPDAVFKWQRQGRADMRDGVDSQQARFVKRLARARGVMGGRLVKATLDGIETPGKADAKAALSALKTFLPRYYSDRALDDQASAEADAPAASEATADPGAVTVELCRCPSCGDDQLPNKKYCGGCGQPMAAKEAG